MKDLLNTISLIAKDMYFYINSYRKINKQTKEPRKMELYTSLRACGEKYNPDSLLGYVICLIAETGFETTEQLSLYTSDLERCFINPYEELINNFAILKKYRQKVIQMHSEIESVKNRLKHGDSLTKKGENAQLELISMSERFKNFQTETINIFKNFLCEEKDAIRNIAVIAERELIFHEECLRLNQQCLTAINSRLGSKYRYPVFGVSLKEHLAVSGHKLSVVIHDCVAWILNNGIDEEGIFRLPSCAQKVEKLVAAYDAGIKIPSYFIISVHAMCALLKQYFRSLPKSLLFVNLNDDEIDLFLKLNNEDFFRELKNIINDLPKEEYTNLKYLFWFLKEVTVHQKKNLMSSQNLGVVFGPGIISEKGLSDSKLLERSIKGNVIVKHLTENTEEYFPGGCVFKTKKYKRISLEVRDQGTSIRLIGLNKESIGSNKYLSGLANEEEQDCLEPPYFFVNPRALEQIVKTD